MNVRLFEYTQEHRHEEKYFSATVLPNSCAMPSVLTRPPASTAWASCMSSAGAEWRS